MTGNDKSTTVKHISLLFSLGFLVAVPFAAFIEKDSDVLSEWLRILFSPCPLVTDYFILGSLASTFLNTGLCGLFWTVLMYALDEGQYNEKFYAGYFLVIAHCFYGLNLFNMLPPALGIMAFCKATGRRFRDKLDKAMLSTAFGPFISELTFRYHTLLTIEISIGQYSFNIVGLFTALLLGLFLGFVIPPMLKGAKALHHGYNLYNGGLAFGLLGLLISSFMYKTLGKTPVSSLTSTMPKPDYIVFANCFFVTIFAICIAVGYVKNNMSFKGYSLMLKDSGHEVAFIEKYGSALTWINLGFYGLMIVTYFNFIIAGLEGAGWTGATFGVTLAAMAFSSSGQHPKNVWPILAGFVVFEVFVTVVCKLSGLPKMWNLSSQEYINAIAFATGLCPFAGCFGNLVGILAGFMCATMCTSTSSIHCGLMLYNGGFTAGTTALLLTPILIYYHRKKLN